MDRQEEQTPHVTAQQARGGEVVLRRKWQRWVFAGGLAAFVVIALFAYSVF